MGREGAGMLGRSQLGRLLQVMLALRGEACPNARQLAELCEVSTRTIYRDLATLGVAGVPVRFSSERRGYVLAASYALAPPRLLDEEIRALIVLVLEGCRSGQAPGGGPGRMAVRKLVESLPEGQRTGARRLLDRMTFDAGPSVGSVFGVLIEAVWRRVEVVVQWRGPLQAVGERLAPYHLHADRAGAWYVVGRVGDGPTLRCEPIACLERAELTDRPFAVPGDFEALAVVARARRLSGRMDAAGVDPFLAPLEVPGLDSEFWRGAVTAAAGPQMRGQAVAPGRDGIETGRPGG